MVFVSPDTPYRKLLSKFLLKKYRLAVDTWGADDKLVKHVYDPLVKLIEDNVPDESHRKIYPYPIWGLKERVTRLARNLLVAEFLVKEWAEHMKGMDEEQLDELAKSFLFENCMKREGLNTVLTEHAEQNANIS